MKEQIERLRIRIDAMSLRERGLLFVVIVAALSMLAQTLLFDPLNVTQKRLVHEISDQQNQTAAMEAQIHAILQRQSTDPNAQYRRQEQQLTAQLSVLNGQIAGKVKGLIAPRQMAKVLESVLDKQMQLRLVRIENLPSKPLIPPQKGKDGNSHTVGIYKHGVRLELEGSYMSALKYVQALQLLPWTLYWDGIQLTTKRYPETRIVITVHTLSMDEGWIGV